MQKVCFILGSALLDMPVAEMELKVVLTEYGKVRLYLMQGKYYLQRHSNGIPPHMINHKANISAIKELGITNIIGINSCGSLKKALKPGTIVVPDDYIDMQNSQTFFDNEIVFTTPGISNTLRKKIISALKKANMKPVERAVYLQTRWPRFETKAEIKFFSKIADIIGMTLANEATLAKEAGLEYASVCTIDNYANGIGTGEISASSLASAQKNNAASVKKMIETIRKVYI